jgi:hypothetical protein
LSQTPTDRNVSDRNVCTRHYGPLASLGHEPRTQTHSLVVEARRVGRARGRIRGVGRRRCRACCVGCAATWAIAEAGAAVRAGAAVGAWAAVRAGAGRGRAENAADGVVSAGDGPGAGVLQGAGEARVGPA